VSSEPRTSEVRAFWAVAVAVATSFESEVRAFWLSAVVVVIAVSTPESQERAFQPAHDNPAATVVAVDRSPVHRNSKHPKPAFNWI